jgi:hypothetical protein
VRVMFEVLFLNESDIHHLASHTDSKVLLVDGEVFYQ